MAVYLLDEVGLGDEAGGAPERVVDVGAERLQLRGEAPVDHSAPSRFGHELLHRAHLPPLHAQLRSRADREVGGETCRDVISGGWGERDIWIGEMRMNETAG